jgi:hypothetical protein
MVGLWRTKDVKARKEARRGITCDVSRGWRDRASVDGKDTFRSHDNQSADVVHVNKATSWR